ncbi:hypothetical protein QX776_02535 [Alteromonadaceae bacterium BrNp21-10]|nr:hypothetical protein [Alteromonadaceae bacterium BrNp21-10]
MKTSILALALISSLSTSASAIEDQSTNPEYIQYYIFNYDFNNLQDPTLRQTQHLLQNLEYKLVRDLQQQRYQALSKIEQQVAIFADADNELLTAQQYF